MSIGRGFRKDCEWWYSMSADVEIIPEPRKNNRSYHVDQAT